VIRECAGRSWQWSRNLGVGVVMVRNYSCYLCSCTPSIAKKKV